MQRSQTAGRTRRSLTSLAAGLALAAAVVGLPATPAAAVIGCKVNAVNNASQSQIQAMLDAGPNVLTFSGTCPGGLFIYRSGLLIKGANAQATVTGDTNFDGTPDSLVFGVASGVTVTFQNLRIVNGRRNSGGGAGVDVLDGASATFNKVMFDGNSAEYGAAILFDTLSVGVITNSTFVNNYAFSYVGGAIATCDSALTVTGSTFTGNRANWYGGALYVDSDCDGGVASVLSITRSTFTGNQAISYDGGAIYLDTVNATIASSVFSRNVARGGGAIGAIDSGDDDPTLAVSNSSFTTNRAEGTSAGALGVTGFEVLRLSGDKFTSNFANEYGGGVATYATDVQIAGSTFASNTARVYHGGGAYIEWYDAAGTPDGVTVTSSSFTGNSAGLTGGGLFTGWTGDVTISGSTFSKNVALNLNCIWFCGTNREGGGGIMLRATDAEISDSVVAENRAVSDGGGIMFFDRDNEGQGCDQLTITRSIIRKNVSGRDGGGLWANGQCERPMYSDDPLQPSAGPQSAVSLEGTIVTQNTADGSGGGIALTGAYCCWDSNEGVYWSDDATTVSQNTAAYDGGGIWAYDWDVTVRGNLVGNRAGRKGGGIFFDMITDWRHILTITDAKVERNIAATYGGGIYFDGDGWYGWLRITDDEGPVSISYNRLSSTAVWAAGGGIYAYYPRYFVMATDNYAYDGQHTVLIKSNFAPLAGGIYLSGCLSGPSGCYMDDGVRVTANTYGGMAGCSNVWLYADFDNNNPLDCI